jgi:HK97 gp10 family phage protein
MAFTFQLDGVEDLRRQLDAAHEDIKAEFKTEVKASTKRLHDDALERAPVRDGGLRASAQMEFSAGGFYGRVRFKAPHAHLLEYGTVAMSARPFLQPAVASEQPKFMQAAMKILEKANNGS